LNIHGKDIKIFSGNSHKELALIFSHVFAQLSTVNSIKEQFLRNFSLIIIAQKNSLQIILQALISFGLAHTFLCNFLM
jgi:hypothetical protein